MCYVNYGTQHLLHAHTRGNHKGCGRLRIRSKPQTIHYGSYESLRTHTQMIHLTSSEKELEDPSSVVNAAGIKHMMSYSTLGEWIFCFCSNVPDPLPVGLHKLDIIGKPAMSVGHLRVATSHILEVSAKAMREYGFTYETHLQVGGEHMFFECRISAELPDTFSELKQSHAECILMQKFIPPTDTNYETTT